MYWKGGTANVCEKRGGILEEGGGGNDEAITMETTQYKG